MQNLRRYVERNPLRHSEDIKRKPDDFKQRPWRKEKDKEKMLFGNGTVKSGCKPTCVYCNSEEHYSLNCTEVLDTAARRAILQRNRLCWNCTGVGHAATQRWSRGCRNCNGKHHTSTCDREKSTLQQFHNARVEKSMSALISHTNTLHPTVLAKLGEETVRVMFDSGAGSSYLCTDIITRLNLKPATTLHRADVWNNGENR